ncbi:hypothetical protein [Roseibium sp. M-1]
MTPFWPFRTLLPVSTPPLSRQSRLEDLNARMSSFLAEKQSCRTTCPKVLDNIKAARSNVQREMAGKR